MKKIAAVAVAFLILLLCSCTQWEDASYVAYECPEELRLMNTDTMDSCGDILETLGLSKEDALRALSDGRMFFTSFFPQTDGEGNGKACVCRTAGGDCHRQYSGTDAEG